MTIMYSDGQQSMYCMLIAEEDDSQNNTKKPNKTDKEHDKYALEYFKSIRTACWKKLDAIYTIRWYKTCMSKQKED